MVIIIITVIIIVSPSSPLFRVEPASAAAARMRGDASATRMQARAVYGHETCPYVYYKNESKCGHTTLSAPLHPPGEVQAQPQAPDTFGAEQDHEIPSAPSAPTVFHYSSSSRSC